jgi:sodium/pantothenate symporter
MIRPDLSLLALYSALLAGLGLPELLRRGGRSSAAAGYAAAQRSLGGVELAFLLVTVYVSGGMLLGTFQAAWRYGLDGLSVPLMHLPVLFLVPGILGKRLAIAARRTDAATPLQVLRSLYTGPVFGWAYGLALAVFLVLFLAGELSLGVRLLQDALRLEPGPALLVLAAPILVPLLAGGCASWRRVALLQGSVLLAGGVLLAVWLYRAGGGAESLTRRLILLDPGLVQPAEPEAVAGLLRGAGIPAGWLASGGFLLFESTSALAFLWVLVGAGGLGMPHLAAIPLLARSSRALLRSMVGGLFLGGLLLLLTGLAGVWSRALAGEGAPSGAAGGLFPAALPAVLPPIVPRLAFLLPLAAVQSTAGFLLLVLSLTAGELVAARRHAANAGDAAFVGEVAVARAAAGRMGVLASLLAAALPVLCIEPGRLDALGRYAAGGLMAVFFPVLMFGVFWKRSSTAGALAGMVCGIGLHLTAGLPQASGPLLLAPALVPLLGSVAAHWLVSRLFPPVPRAPDGKAAPHPGRAS